MRRVEQILKNTAFQDYISHNEAADEKNPFCKHDLVHMMDVARITYILILERNDLDYFVSKANLSGRVAAKEVIYAAGILHDIGKWKEFQTGQDHAAVGAGLARDILGNSQFNDNEIKIITQAIFEHRNISRDMSFLGERLHRADNLSRVCFGCEQAYDCYKAQNRETGVSLMEY